jgi:hypothetical protein
LAEYIHLWFIYSAWISSAEFSFPAILDEEWMKKTRAHGPASGDMIYVTLCYFNSLLLITVFLEWIKRYCIVKLSRVFWSIIGGLRYSLTIFRTVDVADTSICPRLDVSRIENLCTSINPEFGVFPGRLTSESESERSESSETTRWTLLYSIIKCINYDTMTTLGNIQS